jgi:hypothetical protein
MPTQLPREATDFFGDLLLPHVMNILRSDGFEVSVDRPIFCRSFLPISNRFYKLPNFAEVF